MNEIELLQQELKNLKTQRGADLAYISELEDRIREDIPYSDAWVYERTIEGLKHELKDCQVLLDSYKKQILKKNDTRKIR